MYLLSGVEIAFEPIDTNGTSVLNLQSSWDQHCHVQIEDGRFGISYNNVPSPCATSGAEPWCVGESTPAELVTVGLLANALHCRQTSDGYTFAGSPGTEGITKREANLRLGATTDARVIAKLLKNTSVSIVDCAVTADSQGVWYEVIANRQRGWVSARLVAYEKYFNLE